MASVMENEDSTHTSHDNDKASDLSHSSPPSPLSIGVDSLHVSKHLPTADEGVTTPATQKSVKPSGSLHNSSGVSPGDGICPTTSQFNLCYRSKLAQWKHAATAHIRGSDSLDFYIQSFLDLLKEVPPFFHSPPEEVVRNVGDCLIESEICIDSTEDPSCDQPRMSLKYRHFVAKPRPITCCTATEMPTEVTIPATASPLRAGYFTSIALAWSYILSVRWVEILQQAGLECHMFHAKGLQLEKSFWDIVLQGHWEARCSDPEDEEEQLYSPWMLRLSDITYPQDEWEPVASDSALAFGALVEFCKFESLEGELLIGLTSILNLEPWTISRPKFPPPVRIPAMSLSPGPVCKNTIYEKLFRSIDQCMFLSTTGEAIDSLSCSVFFDPSVPCNLLGAGSLGIIEALSPTDTMSKRQLHTEHKPCDDLRPFIDKIDKQQLLNAIMYVKPYLGLFWAAAIYTNQVMPLLRWSLSGIPILCLPAAYWTNTYQSFLQMNYRSASSKELLSTRVDEFQTSHFCLSNTSSLPWPWSPAPPFGSTPVTNLSLEAREHLPHMHRPRSWQIYWILESEQRIPASSKHDFESSEVHTMNYFGCAGNSDELPHPLRSLAEGQSGNGTRRLFCWQRHHEGAIWLDDGAGDVDAIRCMQIHPWIKDPWNNNDFPVSEPEHKELDLEKILKWRDAVEHDGC
ncbi:uncharacterized protein BO95DRAFT_480502 [Aspergillus brunneoviolaceus CBS 621.78]|uniref:Uncharacterized protein n=1 Tax=Aspergillus brunneoviolaceus CBS 621.78 TaxID=1450534 RepID=A0ACD1GFN4_9EURO|nr:hypothetical protein BO95DRAFT_480502 [Aspergillus brunneoviolaceus CBS 621.78]RAH48119.1 hypothetical protein BO95DRAFT_480502 [Aspergillus brunneoviolaceus CBS 621.78]